MINEKKTVLIIDQDVNFVERLNPMFMLDPECSLATAANANDGYAKAQQLRPHFVVIANPLPDAETTSLMAALRSVVPQALFVITLEVENPMQTTQFTNAGASYVMVKPYAGDKLLSILKEIGQKAGQPFGAAAAPQFVMPAPPAQPSTASQLGALRQAMTQFDQAQQGQVPLAQPQPFAPPPMFQQTPMAPAPVSPFAQPQGGFVPQSGFGGSIAPFGQGGMAPSAVPGLQMIAQQPDPRRGGGGLRTIKQTVIAVNCPKGGVGKTTLAKELALAFAAVRINGQPMKVCMVDCDLDFGDAASMLLLQPYPNITHWTSDIAKRLKQNGGIVTDIRYPQTQIEQYLLTHQQTGLKLLAAPSSHGDAINIEGDQMQVVLRNLRNCDFDVIILDTGNNTKDCTLVALDEADYILMVCTMDVASINDVNMLLTTLRQCQFPIDKIKLVVNKLPKTERDIDLSEMQSILRCEIIATIPEYPRIRQLNNSGSPAVLDRDSEFSNAIRRLGHAIVPVFNQRKPARGRGDNGSGAKPPREKRGLFGGLFRK